MILNYALFAILKEFVADKSLKRIKKYRIFTKQFYLTVIFKEAPVYGGISKVHFLPFVDVCGRSHLCADDLLHAVYRRIRPISTEFGLVVISSANIINEKLFLRCETVRMHGQKEFLPFFETNFILFFESF